MLAIQAAVSLLFQHSRLWLPRIGNVHLLIPSACNATILLDISRGYQETCVCSLRQTFWRVWKYVAQVSGEIRNVGEHVFEFHRAYHQKAST
jgi:hypothetical protein